MPRLLERVVQRRRFEQAEAAAPGGAVRAEASRGEQAGPRDELAARVAAVERRLEHLEQLLEGLQDAVHRESVRRGHELDVLARKTEPDEIARELDRHSREHGL